ncbi:MAG: TOBE domain-containing protein, partial [Deltaproteobacteria bacterium]|nr:TOBE domain-containing protein [Deltaproteobacteria bacterium]
VLLASDVGPDTHVHARLGREDLVVRIPGRTDVKPGGKVALEIPAERVHLFRGGLRVPTGA